ncbi:sugar ABC transporter substrate-binding protein [Pseudoclavibacter helvolus]|uniref:Ribose transport system substrate-binding protein/inositol transport system substrate-binding protein n=1 Tax=Pseudoclavibacter helvolus TaxID=255205 RepID=A0A7W4YGV1_9MICO|nr:sugar ABC transporter substrate-binding protein [Pseudoclavibacter helvolus]MBB2959058.1 ribose transport system substrate-binding protein/inositol transport system substrate-binding protein [Pseudoclavibacter helvolus]
MNKQRVLRFSVAMAAASALLLTGCANTGESGDGAGGGENGRIALAMSHMSNEFVKTVAEAAQAKGEELGYEVVVFDGAQDASTQVGQIEQAVSQGYAGILVEPVSKDGVVPGLIAANDAGIPIATIVQQAQDQSLAAAYVGGDEEKAGELQMTEAIEAIGGSGEIALLYGPMGSDAQLARKAGYDLALEKNPGVTIAFEQTGNWVTAEALELTENWLSTGTALKGIVAQNDGMAVGAAQAVTNAGKTGEIPVFGIDATADGVAAINDGSLAGTVSQDTAGIGELGVETIVKVINGEQVESEVLTEATWITKENVDTLGS